jgi:hypothetical protein
VGVKNDPKLVAAPRELRDRWLERVNANASALAGRRKYDVSRQSVPAPAEPKRTPLLGLRRRWLLSTLGRWNTPSIAAHF